MIKSSAEKVKIVDILDEDELYRRIHPSWQKNNGKISSGAFITKPHPVSIDIAKLTTPIKTLSNFPDHWLVSLITKIVRSIGLDACHNPRPENYAHGLIKGKINKTKARRLAESASLVIKK